MIFTHSTNNMDLEAAIRKLYWDDELPIRSVAEKLNISTATLGRRMKSFGIAARDKNHGRNDWWQTEEYLSNSYVKELKSSITIAKEVGSGSRVVCTWLENFNIKRRKRGGELRGKTMSLASREKMSAAKKGKYVGKLNSNWKGNLVSDEVRERRSYIAKKWRKQVTERDDHKCQKCGSRDKLHAHHIKEFKDHPDLRWDLNNGITVCVFCHEKIHNRKFPDWVTGRITEKIDVVKIKPKIEFDITKDKLQALYKSLSMKKIGDMYGVSRTVVRGRILKFGIQTTTSGERRRFNIEKNDLQALYNKLSMKKISEMLGVGETVIHRRIHEYGIKKQF
jgi:biotin operon repressor